MISAHAGDARDDRPRGYSTPTPIQTRRSGPSSRTRHDRLRPDGHRQDAAFVIRPLNSWSGRLAARGSWRRGTARARVAPRELALQIAETFDILGRAQGVRRRPHGGEPMGRSSPGSSEDRRHRGHPGRLFDHLERRSLGLGTLRIVVLDEATACSTWASRPGRAHSSRDAARPADALFLGDDADRGRDAGRGILVRPVRIESV